MLCVIVLALLVSLVCGFKNVFVLVVEDNAYLSSIEGKGILKDLYYGSLESSVVASLAKKQVPWKVYTDDYIGCYLDPVIFSNFSFLISFDDIADYSTRCSHVASSADLVTDFSASTFPTFGFYFPSATNGKNANWLRSFLFTKLSDPNFVENTLVILLSPGEQNKASLLLLGNSRKKGTPERDQEMVNTMQEYGIILTAPPPPPSNASNPWFEKIFIIVLENQPLKDSLADDNMRNLAAQGTLLIEYDAIVNPSQPNYIAMTAGDLMGVTNDENYNITGRFIVDLFEENNVTWKAYMENFPGNCYPDAASPDNKYRRKHNPFISFNQVRENNTRCAKIVNANQLYMDVANNALPQYSFFTPNIDNDGHDTGLAFAGRWLHGFLTPLLQNQHFMDTTLVVVTFDEGIKPDNKIYTLLLGDMIPSGNLDKTSYTHYSLLRLVEDQFSLPSLGRKDTTAVRIDAANFYPGAVPDPPTDMIVYLGIGVISILILCVVGTSLYCVLVVRKRKEKATPSLDLEERDAFLESEASGSDDDIDEKGAKSKKRTTKNARKL